MIYTTRLWESPLGPGREKMWYTLKVWEPFTGSSKPRMLKGLCSLTTSERGPLLSFLCQGWKEPTQEGTPAAAASAGSCQIRCAVRET